MGYAPENSSGKFKIPEKDDSIPIIAMDQFDFLVKPRPATSTPEREEETTTNPTACDEYDEGFKTPTSSDHRIIPLATTTQCPPAPRKPRAVPAAKAKIRKPSSRGRRILLDFSNEVEALFPLTIRKNFRRKIVDDSSKVKEEDVEKKLSN
ncbi:hypothetical protein CDL15_Pgr024996 [Punica granatum]|uniref:Cyclin-dependent protein kinase inhibitor SMR3-like n=1 Tax=Punica granatum TaxID=22663 RepID=A0A218W8J0_PUNGR|nr:hypothetical protein CDL15_Pgr024996 [Punica granatum]PKI36431.1 hypothetical protein CRG98_043213 [Punica granatum]